MRCCSHLHMFLLQKFCYLMQQYEKRIWREHSRKEQREKEGSLPSQDQSEMRAYSLRRANRLGPRELPLTCPRILRSGTTLKMKDGFKNIFVHMQIKPQCDPGYHRAGQESAVIELVLSFSEIGGNGIVNYFFKREILHVFAVKPKKREIARRIAFFIMTLGCIPISGQEKINKYSNKK